MLWSSWSVNSWEIVLVSDVLRIWAEVVSWRGLLLKLLKQQQQSYSRLHTKWSQLINNAYTNWLIASCQTVWIIIFPCRDYKEYHTDTTVRFLITMAEDKLAAAEHSGLHKKFKLESNVNTSNMVSTLWFLAITRKVESKWEVLKPAVNNTIVSAHIWMVHMLAVISMHNLMFSNVKSKQIGICWSKYLETCKNEMMNYIHYFTLDTLSISILLNILLLQFQNF